jgi:hypothetical protein
MAAARPDRQLDVKEWGSEDKPRLGTPNQGVGCAMRASMGGF